MISPAYVPEGRQLKGQRCRFAKGGSKLPGCTPGEKTSLVVYDRIKGEGAFVELTPGENAEHEVHLAKGVTARLKITGKAAKSKTPPQFKTELVFRPGPSINESYQVGGLATLSLWYDRLLGAASKPEQGDDGDYILDGLIPDMTYTLWTTIPNYSPTRTTFKAPPPGSTKPIIIDIEPLELKPPKK